MQLFRECNVLLRQRMTETRLPSCAIEEALNALICPTRPRFSEQLAKPSFKSALNPAHIANFAARQNARKVSNTARVFGTSCVRNKSVFPKAANTAKPTVLSRMAHEPPLESWPDLSQPPLCCQAGLTCFNAARSPLPWSR